MNNLKRELAPVSTAAWKEIDAEASRVLKLKLAGRKLVDFDGPLGPTAAAVNTGRREPLSSAPAADIEASRRQVLPLVELRSYFELSREEMDPVERGAEDPELQSLIDAATRIAYAEDTAIFHGYAAGGIKGIDQASAHPILPIPDDYQEYPHSIAEATRLLRLAGVDGPTPSPWGRATTPDSPRRWATAVTRCSTSSASWWTARSCGRPRSRARWC